MAGFDFRFRAYELSGKAESLLVMESTTPIKVDYQKPRGAFRVLHTADWHLGKNLGEHSRGEEHARFLSFLLERIRELSVDALLVAGDIFDSANPPQGAVKQYYDFLSTLYRQGGCSVVIIAGNHDSPAQLEAPRQILRALGAHVNGEMPQDPSEILVPLPDANSPVLVVAAVPFLRDRDLRTGESGQTDRDIRQALVDGIKRRYDEVANAAKRWAKDGVPLVAMGHLTVTGTIGSESEREIHVGGLGAIGADCFAEKFGYVGLGHLHRPQAAKGFDMVRYSGSPIPLSFSEAMDKKVVQLLDFVNGKVIEQKSIEIPLSRPLHQIVTSRQALESDLMSFQPRPSELPAWVQVVIEDSIAGENLYDRVQELTRGKSYNVILVLQPRATGKSGFTVDGVIDVAGMANLLDQPANVFERRLELESGLTNKEQEALKTAFKQLLNLHAEQERMAGAGGQ